MRCIVFFGSWFVVDLFFIFICFFLFGFFVLFTVFRPKAFLWRPGPSAKIWLFFEYIIVRKMFCKNFDDDIRNKHLKMGAVVSCLPEECTLC